MMPMTPLNATTASPKYVQVVAVIWPSNTRE
jgi:hypothetical protein